MRTAVAKCERRVSQITLRDWCHVLLCGVTNPTFLTAAFLSARHLIAFLKTFSYILCVRLFFLVVVCARTPAWHLLFFQVSCHIEASFFHLSPAAAAATTTIRDGRSLRRLRFQQRCHIHAQTGVSEASARGSAPCRRRRRCSYYRPPAETQTRRNVPVASNPVAANGAAVFFLAVVIFVLSACTEALSFGCYG